jgi:hypothetical protein
MVRKILPMLLVLIGLSLVGCGEYGKVEQGRTVGFDTTKTPPVVWIIKDNGLVEGKPQYDVLPAHEFTLPAEKSERGADPFVGKRINLNVDGKIITMYNEKTQQFDKLPFEVKEDHMNVSVRARHPLVWDDATGKERMFPQINEEEKLITIYSRRQSRLTTIKLSAEDFAKYKGTDWDAGDEVRIYYKQPGKALRFMNITKTDFSRRK